MKHYQTLLWKVAFPECIIGTFTPRGAIFSENFSSTLGIRGIRTVWGNLFSTLHYLHPQAGWEFASPLDYGALQLPPCCIPDPEIRSTLPGMASGCHNLFILAGKGPGTCTVSIAFRGNGAKRHEKGENTGSDRHTQSVMSQWVERRRHQRCVDYKRRRRLPQRGANSRLSTTEYGSVHHCP